jgi:hypothetical protein
MPRKGDSQRWKGWRETQAPAPIVGDQPTKKPGTRAKKRKRPQPWFWVKASRDNECGSCRREIRAGVVFAFSRPKKALCRACVEAKDLKPTASRKLKEERRKMVERQLRKRRGDDAAG